MKKAIILTPTNLSQETFDFICQGVKDKFKEDFAFIREEDSSLIGGFVLNIDGTIYDLSVKSQIEKIKTHIEK